MMETTRLGLPFGGTWRFRQEPVLGEHATKKGLILAWDTPSATKIFGIYQDYPKAELMQRLLALPAELRNCYEVIPKTDMCTGYAVLKWAGAPDPTHAVMHAALELLRLRCETQLHLQPDVCAYCGSHPHPDTGETQHVYHIIVQNLVFQDNHNGQMRSCPTAAPPASRPRSSAWDPSRPRSSSRARSSPPPPRSSSTRFAALAGRLYSPGSFSSPRRALGRPQRALGRPQRALGRPRRALGRPRGVLVGPQMALVGPRMALVGPQMALVGPSPSQQMALAGP
jgi:hypothetical protein